MVIVIASLLALVFAAIATRSLVGARGWLRWMDEPNPRSLHDTPVPRTGGLGILAGCIAGWSVVALGLGMPTWFHWAGLALILVFIASLVDDWRGVGILPRLVTQLAAAGILLYAGLLPEALEIAGWTWSWPQWLAAVFSLLFLVWMTNLYNFMDGMDGFAGGMAVFGFGFMGLLGWQADAWVFAALNAVVASAAAGFLLFNFPPARIFMGDMGASTLGLLAGAAMLWADRDGIFPLWIGILIFSPFIVDATLTLVAGIIGRERVWEPHRRHCYQRLVRRGWGHRRTVLAEYALMLLVGVTALWLSLGFGSSCSGGILGAWIVIYAIIFFSIVRLDLRR